MELTLRWSFVVSDTKTRKGISKMADMEDETRVKDGEKVDESITLNVSSDNNNSELTEERIRVDRRKLEILLQGCY